jgi:tetratricopeptide (TPR) repeat protein
MKTNIAALVVCGCFLALGLFSINDTMYYTPDSANYLGWAKSVASLEGFKLTYGPEITRYVINAPLYAVLLSPAALVFPMSLAAAKIVTLLFGVLLLFIFYKYCTARTGATATLLTMVLFALNPQLLLFSTQILSDVPFAVCTLLVFMIVERLVSERTPPQWTFWTLLVLLAAGIHLREVGFALLLAVAAFFAFRKEYTRAGIVFLAPLAVYLLWYFRNEVIIASRELPDLRNTKLFFGHLFTDQSESLLAEFLARIGNNLSFYAAPLGGLVFIPQYVGWMFSVVRYDDPLFSSTQSVVASLEWVIVGITVAVSSFGLYRIGKTSAIGVLVILFVAFYSGIVILYPISDDRFLLPVLLLAMMCIAMTVKEVHSWITLKPRHSSRAWFGAMFLLIIACSIPNIVWLNNFVSTNAANNTAPDGFYNEIKNQVRYPIEYTKRFKQAGEWVAAQNNPQAIVASHYKEAGTWLGDRRVLSLDLLIAPEDFDVTLRDYECPFVIVHLAGHQLRDFEFQMAVSRRFRFEPVFRAGDVEVLRVDRRGNAPPARDPSVPDSVNAARTQFLAGIRSLTGGDYRAARAAFESLRGIDGLEAPATFYAAVAAEFSMELTDSRQLFRELGLMPQAGALLRQGRSHLEVISWLDSAAQTTSGIERASFYHSSSLSYWLLGFRTPAKEMLQRSMDADPTYFLGPVFGALYEIQEGNAVKAEEYVRLAERLRPTNELVIALKRIVGCADSLQTETDPRRRAPLHLSVGTEYRSIGLNDFAVDEFLSVLETEPDNADALKSLASIYVSKRRFAPAAKMLERMLASNPQDGWAREQLEELRRR